jgi:prephenate dehydrogenase
MLGKTVIDKENTSRIFLIWRVLVLKVPCVLLKVRDVDTHFKQNRKQVVKTLNEYISNLSKFKEL